MCQVNANSSFTAPGQPFWTSEDLARLVEEYGLDLHAAAFYR